MSTHFQTISFWNLIWLLLLQTAPPYIYNLVLPTPFQLKAKHFNLFALLLSQTSSDSFDLYLVTDCHLQTWFAEPELSGHPVQINKRLDAKPWWTPIFSLLSLFTPQFCCSHIISCCRWIPLMQNVFLSAPVVFCVHFIHRYTGSSNFLCPSLPTLSNQIFKVLLLEQSVNYVLILSLCQLSRIYEHVWVIVFKKTKHRVSYITSLFSGQLWHLPVSLWLSCSLSLIWRNPDEICVSKRLQSVFIAVLTFTTSE